MSRRLPIPGPRRTALAVGLALALAGPAGAVLIEQGDGTGNVGPPFPVPELAHVGSKNGVLTLIYLGNGWVMTAAHANSGDLLLDGVVYPRVNGSKVQIVHDPAGPTYADVILFRVAGNPELPDLPLLEIAESTPDPGTLAWGIGNGVARGPATRWNPPGPGSFDGYEWGAGTAIRWGRNEVTTSWPDVEALGQTTDTFLLEFDPPGSAPALADEFIGALGDSGGAVFVSDGAGGHELAGVFILTTNYEDQPPSTALYGNASIAVDLARYRDQIIPVVRPECADEVDNDGDGDVDWPDDASCASPEADSEDDLDGDGVPDEDDNCLELPNADQCDADLDGYGNRCDADFSQDGAVGNPDYVSLAGALYTSGPPGTLVHDLDCDGAVGNPDFNAFRSAFGGVPGPSGLACAGTAPCPP